jgi:exodeoxyribonuclease VII large subunit
VSVFYHYNADVITVEGQTYRYRDRLKALGARFHGQQKVWQLPNTPAVLESVRSLCTQVGGGILNPLPLLAQENDEPRAGASREKPLTPSQDRGNSSPLSPPPGLFPNLASTSSLEPAPDPEQARDKLADSLSVSQLMGMLNLAIRERFQQAVWVVGEVQNLNARAQVTYFTLAEQDENQGTGARATVQALLWRHTVKSLEKRHGSEELSAILQEGMQIRCLCEISVYAGRGSISLSVIDMDPSFTKGALALAREKLLKELRAKGLDRANKLRLPPPLPFRIGLLSADNSRALGDFLHQLEVGGYPGEILFVSIPMQGAKVAQVIKAAIAQLCAERCDLIIITRGGGSAADLQAFDSPEVAYAIAHCPLPVIAAIGHHDDYCVAEEICYQRRKTPTAAADFVLECFSAVRERLSNAATTMGELLNRMLTRVDQQQALFGDRLYHSSARALAKKQERLLVLAPRLEKYFLQLLTKVERRGEELVTKLSHRALQNTYQEEQRLARVWVRRLDQSIDRHLEQQTRGLELLAQGFIRRDPKPWLKQGWTCLEGADGRRLSSVKELHPGDEVKARLLDGRLTLQINTID